MSEIEYEGVGEQDVIKAEELQDELVELGEPHAKPDRRTDGVVVGCELDQWGIRVCAKCKDTELEDKLCPRRVDDSPWHVIRRVHPCPECLSKKTAIFEYTEPLWWCPECDNEFTPSDPYADPDDDDDDDDNESIPWKIPTDIQVFDDKLVISGENFNEFKAIQSHFGDGASYGYDEENEVWTITLSK